MQVREHAGLLQADTSLVLVVDMQEAFRSGLRGFGSILPRALQIVNAARMLGIPLVGSEQSPQRMGATVPEIVQQADARQFHPKETFSALQSASIVESIANNRPRSVVLLGCETHVAVLQTAFQLLSTFDGDVHVVVDATASRRDADRDLALARMGRTGAHLTSTEMVLFEWIRDTRHPKFPQLGSSNSSAGSPSTAPSSVSRGPESTID